MAILVPLIDEQGRDFEAQVETREEDGRVVWSGVCWDSGYPVGHAISGVSASMADVHGDVQAKVRAEGIHGGRRNKD
ncbi:hypothetical protein [Rhodanobacter aciditrophus]|uniref:hypothetical protein n=1 Tax=Rhodanobacter aciditrophus TaxID=1623218 RepID=UPI003CF3856F